MKISKEKWREVRRGITELMNFKDTPVRPLPDVRLGDEIYNPKVDHPKHYNTGKYETIDIIEDWNLDFHCGSAVKYISRHKYKENPKQDIEKAIWYLQRYLKTLGEK